MEINITIAKKQKNILDFNNEINYVKTNIEQLEQTIAEKDELIS